MVYNLQDREGLHTIGVNIDVHDGVRIKTGTGVWVSFRVIYTV